MRLSLLLVVFGFAAFAPVTLGQEGDPTGYTPNKKTALTAFPGYVLVNDRVTLIAKLTDNDKPVSDVVVHFYMGDEEISYKDQPAKTTNKQGIASIESRPIDKPAGTRVKFSARPEQGFPKSNDVSVLVVGGAWKEDPEHKCQGFDILNAGLWDVADYPWTVAEEARTTQAAMLQLATTPTNDVSISADLAKAKITPVTTRRDKTNTPIEGVKTPGTTAIAGNPGEITHLNISVKKKIAYTADFYYAVDGAPTPHKTKRTSTVEDAVRDTLKQVWRLQSGVELAKGASNPLPLTGDWGNTLSKAQVQELMTSVIKMKAGTIAIVFVWEAQTPAGYTGNIPCCLIKDSASDANLGRLASHEVGHAMGLLTEGVDSDYPPADDLHNLDIMATPTTQVSRRVHKFQADIIHAAYGK
jgi:hypothetical protein